MFGEYRDVAERVVDPGVIVVEDGFGEQDLDLGALGGEREAIDEGGVGSGA